MTTVAAMLAAVALQQGVPSDLLQAICWVETKHQNVVHIDDGGSASIGLCQVKIKTARWLARKYRRKFQPSDLFDLRTNATYAAIYLRYQLHRYDNNWARASDAYNKGSAKQRGEFDSCDSSGYYKNVREALRLKLWLEKDEMNSSSRRLLSSTSPSPNE